MRILREREARLDISQLDRVWSDPETVIFLPDKAGVDVDWIDARVNAIPRPYGRGSFVLLTSGTTGRPKMVVGSRARAELLANLLHKVQESEPVESTICILPLTYSYSLINQWLWARVCGRSFVLSNGFSDRAALENALQTVPRSMLCMVGGQVPLLRQQLPNAVFPEVIRLHFAGGRFPQERLGYLREVFPNAVIFNNYGCAEAMPRLTLRRAEDGEIAEDIGVPIQGVQLKTDSRGELLFKSEYSAVAFLDEDGFHPVDRGTWIPTGDLAEKQGGGHWRLLGRKSEVFKRFGEKISLPTLLNSVGAVWPHSAVFYQSVDSIGETAHVLVLAPHPNPSQLREVLRCFRRGFPRTHWPLRIESTNEVPTLPNGKPDIRALVELEDRREQWRQRL